MLKIYRIADHWIEYCFQHPDTARYFERFEVDADIPAGEPVIPVQASPLFIEQSAVKRGHTYFFHTHRDGDIGQVNAALKAA